jgi:hypothetical protein
VSRSPEWLFDLLPAFLRNADYEEGGPLRALMSVLEMQYQAIESDLDLLYDNWFVETCDEWVLPYLGDLLALRGLSGARPEVFSLRGRVGNAMARRRRKGTLAGLAGAVRDGTGWAPHVVRYRDRTAASWSVRDGEPGPQPASAVNLKLSSLRVEHGAPTSLDDPWHGAARTAGISGLPPAEAADAGVSPRGGRFMPGALGVYLWRLNFYPVRRGAARQLPSRGTRFTASPFGIDQPLYWQRPAADAPGEEAGFDTVPEPLGRDALAAELARPRGLQAFVAAATGAGGAHSGGGATAGAADLAAEPDPDAAPPLEVFVSEGVGEPFVEVPPELMVVADLGAWSFPPAGIADRQLPAAADRQPPASAARGRRPPRLAVDPVHGRLLFADDNPVRSVRASYGYGAAADLGGGAYPRRTSAPLTGREGHWEAVVSRDAPVEALPALGAFAREGEEGVALYRTLEQALAAWIAAAATWLIEPQAPNHARVRILDSAIYDVGVLPLALPPACRRLVIEAGAGECPCIVGDLAFRTVARDDELRPEVLLSGLWIDGRVNVGGAILLRLDHCTVRPPATPAEAAAGSIVALAAATVHQLAVEIRASVVGPVLLPAQCRSIEVFDSVLDAGPAAAGGGEPRALGGPAATLARTTVFGATAVARLAAASCIFTGAVTVDDTSQGAVRASYLPPGSATPPREACQPVTGDSRDESGAVVEPHFTSRRFGDPGYAQLARSTSARISTGGADGSEMGVFHGLYQPQRQDNLPAVLEEFVPWGATVFVEFVT